MNLHDPASFADMPRPEPRFADDTARLKVLESFEPDALEDDPELAAITAFAARLTGMPIAQVTLVEEERQRFLAGEGLDVRETPRSVSFCDTAMRNGELMEVRDATKDVRFADNALVKDPPLIRYYAGQPLVSAEGAPLGALCVIDTRPNAEGLNDFQREGLAVLGQAVMRRLQYRRETIMARAELAEREQRMKRIIEGVPQIAWSANADGDFDYFNARWVEHIGSEPPRTAQDWKEVIHPDDWQDTYDEWQRCFAAGEEYDAEYRMKSVDGSWRWMLALAVPVAERAGEPARWFGTVTDIDETRSAFEERDLLAKELSHRIKNIFAVITGLVSLKSRRSPEHKAFADEFSDTLRALGRAHEFVRPDALGEQECLKEMLQSLFTPYVNGADEPRIRVTGINTQVAARAATPFALVFHELATNSAKYGALSVDDGFVTLDLLDAGKDIMMRWTEHGGPAPAEPEELGFGTRLVEMSITNQLQGSWERRFDADGLVVEMIVAKAAIAD